MRTVIGSTNRLNWCYNLLGSYYVLWQVPNDVGTIVLMKTGTAYNYYGATLGTRMTEYVQKYDNFTSSTLWSRVDIQSQNRGSPLGLGIPYAYTIYPDIQTTGTLFSLNITASMFAPALTEDFRGKYFYGMDGSNYYTRFAGITHAIVEDKRWSATIYGTLVATRYVNYEEFATLVFRGTNNSPFPITARRIVLFGSYTGTAASNATLAYVTKGACQTQGGNVSLMSGDWDDFEAGDVWAGTFIISPFFGTFKYTLFEEEVTA